MMADSGDLTIRRVDSVAVIQAPQYINSDGGQHISQAVAGLTEDGVARVVLNLSDCSIANSIGLSFLIEILDELKKAGGQLAFCSATKSIAKTLQIMGLLQEATIHTPWRGRSSCRSGRNNASGQRIRTLADGNFASGRHQIYWDGRDDAGRVVATGIYICRLRAGAFAQNRKMLLADGGGGGAGIGKVAIQAAPFSVEMTGGHHRDRPVAPPDLTLCPTSARLHCPWVRSRGPLLRGSCPCMSTDCQRQQRKCRI